MKKYINKVTGAIVDSSFTISGKNWSVYDKELVLDDINDDEVNDDDNHVNQEDEVDLNNLKKHELIDLAKEYGISIDETAKKSEIIEELIQAFE